MRITLVDVSTIISMHIESAKAAALMHEAFVPENHGYVRIILSRYR